MDPKLYLNVGMVIIALSCLTMGPEAALHMSRDRPQLCLALFLMGAGSAFSFVPDMSIIISYMREIYVLQSDYNRVSDMSTSLVSLFMALGAVIGPIVCTQLIDLYGFSRALSLIALGLLVLQWVYVLFCDGYKTLCSLVARPSIYINLDSPS